MVGPFDIHHGARHATPIDILLDPVALCVLGLFGGLMLWERLARPLDMIGWTLVSSVAFGLVGLPAQAATPAILFITCLSIFQHANVRTPRWLGYVVQRPERHSLHHARHVHRDNYADLPVIDMLFGTFCNPPRHAAKTGFWHGASSRVIDMLLLRDVSSRPADRR